MDEPYLAVFRRVAAANLDRPLHAFDRFGDAAAEGSSSAPGRV
jgi:hypothetical protein